MQTSRKRIFALALVAGASLGLTQAEAQCYPGLPCPGQPDGQNGAGASTTAPAAQAKVEYHYVGPVFPPDPWLALRSVPAPKGGKQLMKMPEGTLFQVKEKRGKWWFVELRDGTRGWAHSDWIQCCKHADE